ncbi:MAG: hypothetical protein ACRDYY_16715, partial [Acidimicrobiales bacterium]
SVHLRFESPRRQRAVVFLGVSEGSAAPVFSVRQELVLGEGRTDSSCTIAALPLPRGRYYAWVAVIDPSGADLTPWHPVVSFDVRGDDLDPALPGVMRLSPVHVDARWDGDPAEVIGPAPLGRRGLGAV